MEKVGLTTTDVAAENAAKLAELFPDIVTEVLDEDGILRHSIDVEALKAHVGDIAEDKRERYQFTWPGKQRARAEAIRSIDKTMRPCPEESVHWDTTENLYIEGDNLDALKILRETYAGKIKMIYIDPPYNTGHDFVYNDSFARSAEEERGESGAFDEEGNVLDAAYKVNSESNGRFHSDWCSMMYPRLVLARDLLSEDGVIFVSIDDGELVSSKLICSEVFGAMNFQGHIHWRRRKNQPNDRNKMIGLVAEHLICFSKNDACYRESGVGKLPLTGKFSNPDNDPKGPWNSKPWKVGTGQGGSSYIITTPTGQRIDGVWMGSEATYLELLEAGSIYFPNSGNGLPRKKIYEFERLKEGQCANNWWNFDLAGSNEEASAALAADFFDGIKGIFSNPKPVKLIKLLVQLANVGENDTVLDFFSGSATTAHAVMQLNAEDGGNRKFIMVQLPEACDERSEAAKAGYENICEIGKERIRRAGKKVVSEVEEANAQLKLGEEPKKVPDIGFRVLKIDSSNFEDVKRTPDAFRQDALVGLADNLKSDRSTEDILFQLFPQFEIPYTARIEKLDMDGKTVYSVDDDTLLACFDQDVPESVIRAMAQREPSRAVLRDASFIGDDALANFEEIFKTISPETEIRVV